MASRGTLTTAALSGSGALGSGGNVTWVQIPVAHLSFETDIHFSIIHCLIPTS